MSGEIHDSFNRSGSLGTADSGHTWTLQSQGPHNDAGTVITPGTSSFSLDGSVANGSSTTRMDIATIDHGTPSTTIDVQVVLPWTAGRGVGVVFRHDAAAEFWIYMLYRSSGSGYQTYLRKYTSSTTWDTIGLTSNVLTSSATGTYTIRATPSGDSVGGTIVGVGGGQSATDTFNRYATHHGILSYFAPDGDITSYLADAAVPVRWYAGRITI